MKKLIAVLGLFASISMAQPANATTAVKCLGEFNSTNWPYYSVDKYTPNNTTFKFVCPGISGTKTIPQLYQLGWSLVGLPWTEQIMGGYTSYAIWITHP